MPYYTPPFYTFVGTSDDTTTTRIDWTAQGANQWGVASHDHTECWGVASHDHTEYLRSPLGWDGRRKGLVLADANGELLCGYESSCALFSISGGRLWVSTSHRAMIAEELLENS